MPQVPACVAADALVGGAAAPFALVSGFPVAVLSVNATALSRARLQTALQHADQVGAHVICLQETRHGSRFVWASRLASSAGWRCNWSPSPPGSRPDVPR